MIETQAEIAQHKIKTNKNIEKETQVEYSEKKRKRYKGDAL